MSQEEVDQELLECARYGEDDDLRMMLEQYKANVNYKDSLGNTALHRAAANGQVGCMTILKEHNALFLPNIQGNLPSHWAAQNGQAEALKFLVANYTFDMLSKNDAGRSTLTEAFASGNTDAIEVCLSHDSATEDRLLTGQTNGEAADATKEGIPEETEGDIAETEEGEGVEGESNELDEKNAVVHVMQLAPEATITIRELPITRADHPFGSEACPEDDTTGLGIWPASILLARWVALLGPAALKGKTVVELGAGCGLPSLAAAVHGQAKAVYLTDIHEPTLQNALHNVTLNSANANSADRNAAAAESVVLGQATVRTTAPDTTSEVIVQCVNWLDRATFPPQQAEVLLGSDLVYDSAILDILVPAIEQLLSPTGYLLYVAPITGRDGMAQLVERLASAGIICVEQVAVPDELYANPLQNGDEDAFVLYFYDLAAKAPHTFYKFAFASNDALPTAPAISLSTVSANAIADGEEEGKVTMPPTPPV